MNFDQPMGKTTVAPTKYILIPSFQLTAALVSVKTTRLLRKELGLDMKEGSKLIIK